MLVSVWGPEIATASSAATSVNTRWCDTSSAASLMLVPSTFGSAWVNEYVAVPLASVATVVAETEAKVAAFGFEIVWVTVMELSGCATAA